MQCSTSNHRLQTNSCFFFPRIMVRQSCITAGKIKVVKLNIIKIQCSPSVVTTASRYCHQNSPLSLWNLLYFLSWLFSAWIHSGFEVLSSSVVPGIRGWVMRLDELISIMKGHHQTTDHHMTSSSQWPRPGPGIHQRCSGPTRCLSGEGTGKTTV